MPIRGITEIERPTRLGKIRTGIKSKSERGNEYPTEVDYFVLNPMEPTDHQGDAKENPHIRRVIEQYGEKPTELKIIFPVDDDELVMRHYMTWWGRNSKTGTGTKVCTGDGQYATYTGLEHVSGMDASDYPPNRNRICDISICPQAQKVGSKAPLCKPNMNLVFFIPTVSLFGAFQLDTTSVQAIQGVVSSMNIARNALRIKYGITQIAGVPMRMFRRKTPNSYGGVNHIIHIEVDEDDLDFQIRMYKEKKYSTLGMRDQKYYIDVGLLDEPNYDLLPKSEFPNQTQTGEVPMIEIHCDYEGWIADPEISELFDKLATSRGAVATPAKKMATAKNHTSKDSLLAYLLEQTQN